MSEFLLQSGTVIFILVGSFVVALVLGLLLLARYRRVVDRLMRETTGPAPMDDRPRRRPDQLLKLRLERVPASLRPFSVPPGPIRRAALIELAGGLAFGLLAALLFLRFAGLEILPLRLAAATSAFAWPSVLALNLLWGPDRRRQLATVGAYLGAVLLLSVLSGIIGGAGNFVNTIALWALFASYSLVFLLFLNRTIRRVGPVLVVIAVPSLFGAILALSLLTTDAGVRVVGELAYAAGGGTWTAILGTAAAGLAPGVVIGWSAAGTLAKAHARKRFGEQTLVTDAIWLVQTLVLTALLVIDGDPSGFIAALLPFAAYKAITVLAHLRAAAALSQRPGRPLLLLRVFGFRRRTGRLADLLAARWRHFGPVRLIAAPDLAGRTVTPLMFLAFLRGGLGGLFIRDRTGLERRLEALDGAPDPDARFRVEDLFCAGDMWREAVRRLMLDASAVVMDLRSFGPRNQGCTFELQALLDFVPLRQIFLLVDGTTDLDLLRATLGRQWRRLDIASPNQRAPQPTVCLLDVAAGEVAAVERLLGEALDPVIESSGLEARSTAT